MSKPIAMELPAAERGWSLADIRRFERLKAKLSRTDLKPKQREAAERELDNLLRAPAERQDAAWRERALAETLDSAARRGEKIATIQRPGETNKTIRRMSGLDWLWSKGRLETKQMAAGMKYGDLYRMANDVSLRSCAAEGIGGGSGLEPIEIRMAAQDALSDARLDGLNSHPEMTWLCDRIAGEGDRIRDLVSGDDRRAEKAEAVFGVALDLLAKHFGMSN